MKPLSIVVTSSANPHVKFYYEDLSNTTFFELEAICEEDPARLKYAEDFFATNGMKIAFYTDWRLMMEKHQGVDAVIVGSDIFHHHEQVMAAALGKHVYSMKVLSMDQAQCREMIAACRKAKVPLQVELVLHFNAQYRRMRERIRAGALGKLDALYISNISQSPICYYPKEIRSSPTERSCPSAPAKWCAGEGHSRWRTTWPSRVNWRAGRKSSSTLLTPTWRNRPILVDSTGPNPWKSWSRPTGKRASSPPTIGTSRPI